jgi:hypothetical protein
MSSTEEYQDTFKIRMLVLNNQRKEIKMKKLTVLLAMSLSLFSHATFAKSSKEEINSICKVQSVKIRPDDEHVKTKSAHGKWGISDENALQVEKAADKEWLDYKVENQEIFDFIAPLMQSRVVFLHVTKDDKSQTKVILPDGTVEYFDNIWKPGRTMFRMKLNDVFTLRVSPISSGDRKHAEFLLDEMSPRGGNPETRSLGNLICE